MPRAVSTFSSRCLIFNPEPKCKVRRVCDFSCPNLERASSGCVKHPCGCAYRLHCFSMELLRKTRSVGVSAVVIRPVRLRSCFLGVHSRTKPVIPNRSSRKPGNNRSGKRLYKPRWRIESALQVNGLQAHRNALRYIGTKLPGLRLPCNRTHSVRVSKSVIIQKYARVLLLYFSVPKKTDVSANGWPTPPT